MAEEWKVPFMKPPFGDEELCACERVLRTRYVSKGEEVQEFERELGDYLGQGQNHGPHVITCNSGTSALELVFQGLIFEGRMARGEKVLLPSFTFVGVANAVCNAGLMPVFGDIDPDTYCLNVEEIPDDVRAILAVHTYGHPCDMEKMKLYTDGWRILIEDCAEALGARWGNRMVGTFGDAAILSYNATKNMTTGEGGAMVTYDHSLAYTLSALREHGFTQPEANPRISYMLGHGMRLTNFQAAIGREQLRKLDRMNEARGKAALMLDTYLMGGSIEISLPLEPPSRHVYQLYTIRVDSRSTRDRLFNYLREAGIEAGIYFDPPIHEQPFYLHFQRLGNLAVTSTVSKDVLSLPMHPHLTDEEIVYMATRVMEGIR